VSVHLESGDDVVIVEGSVEEVRESDKVTMRKLDSASKAKYKMPLMTIPGESVIYAVRPRVVLAWTERGFPKDATRWELGIRRDRDAIPMVFRLTGRSVIVPVGSCGKMRCVRQKENPHPKSFPKNGKDLGWGTLAGWGRQIVTWKSDFDETRVRTNPPYLRRKRERLGWGTVA